jgi:hypothetical protein
LTKLTIPEGVSELGDNSFRGCKNLQELVLPASLQKLGNSAFRDCESLTKLTIPEGVSELNYPSFAGCKSLQELILPSSLQKIGDHTFSDCESLTKLTIPEGVSELSDFTFHGCKNLQELVLPASLQKLGSSVFFGCESLTKLTIPEGVSELGDNSFRGCKNLQELVLPASVQEIKDDAIGEGIVKLEFLGDKLKVDDKAFRRCWQLGTVIVPRGTRPYYKALLRSHDIGPNSVRILEKESEDVDSKKEISDKERDSRYVLLDKNGNSLWGDEYDSIEYAFDDVFIVKKGGEYQLKKSSGELLVDSTFKNVCKKVSSNLINVAVDGNEKWIDRYGHYVDPADFPEYEFGELKDGYRKVTKKVCNQKDKFGFAAKECYIVITPKFDAVEDFENGKAKVEVDGKYGFIDACGNYILEPFWDSPVCTLKYGVYEDGAYYGLKDREGNVVVSAKYEEITLNSENPDMFVTKLDGKQGLIDGKSGMVVIEPIFEKVSYENENLVIVDVDGKKKAFNPKTGEPVIETEFERLEYFKDADMLMGYVDSCYTYYHGDGKVKCLSKYYDEFGESNGYIVPLRIVDKWFAVNFNGDAVINAGYEKILKMPGRMEYLLKDRGGVMLTDKKGKIITVRKGWDETYYRYFHSIRPLNIDLDPEKKFYELSDDEFKIIDNQGNYFMDHDYSNIEIDSPQRCSNPKIYAYRQINDSEEMEITDRDNISVEIEGSYVLDERLRNVLCFCIENDNTVRESSFGKVIYNVNQGRIIRMNQDHYTVPRLITLELSGNSGIGAGWTAITLDGHQLFAPNSQYKELMPVGEYIIAEKK